MSTGDYGHFAPVVPRRRARGSWSWSPDRETPEPHWVLDTVALAGTATPDAVSGQPRDHLCVPVALDGGQRGTRPSGAAKVPLLDRGVGE